MGRNFQRGSQKCGFYDHNQLPHGGPKERKRREVDDDDFRYDTNNPKMGVKQITTGFSKWATRYIGGCSGQRNSKYQVFRMHKWNKQLQAHLAIHSGHGIK